ncbi:MAG: TerC family protein [Gemmatimonadota bacterium]
MSSALLGWLGFAVLVVGVLALDLGVGQRSDRAMPVREALRWSALWIAVAVLFGVGINARLGGEKALEFFTGYVVELSLSADNIFVFLMLFTYFRVPDPYRHKVLLWGILGALVMRGVFIAAGVTLIQRFHMVFYVFGALLIASGVKMAFERDVEIHPERNPLLRLARRLLPVTKAYVGDRFFTFEGGRRYATPLFIVLLVVETTDLVFAIDSIPAVLAITQDPFIVYTSNIFAVLGLRAMFFALSGVMGLFRYLSVGLSVILVLIGAKMLLIDVVAIPTAVSLLVVAVILAVSVAASVLRPAGKGGGDGS